MEGKGKVSKDLKKCENKIKHRSINSKMDEKLKSLSSFLEKVRVKRDRKNVDPYTHTTKPSEYFPSGLYYIRGDNEEEFIKKYSNAVIKGVNPSVTEMPEKYGPLRVDFDFKADLSVGSKRQYTEKHLKQIVKYYQDEIRNCVDDDAYNKKLLYCIVLEKESPRIEDSVVKDGFHLHFPNFICDGELQDHYLRNKVTIKMFEEDIWKDCKFITKIDDMIDLGMSVKPWMMYGSMNYKNSKSTPYMYNRWEGQDKKWGHAYNSKLEEIEIKEIFKKLMEGRSSSMKYYMPRFMSIRGYKKCVPLEENVQKKILSSVVVKKVKKRKKVEVIKKRSTEDVLRDLCAIRDGEIMNMIDAERAEDYDKWMDMGWTLFNISQGMDEGLQMWVEFSQKSSKYKDGECQELWNKMELRDKTMGSLLCMAKNDSPDEYKEWKNANVNGFIKKSLLPNKPNEYDISLVINCMYRDRFVCANAKKDIWYEFRDHRWRKMDDNMSLRRLLTADIVDLYYNYKASISNSQNSENDNDIRKVEKKIYQVIDVLKTCPFGDKVIKMSRIQMHDDTFLRKLDSNRMLLGCENGVIDLDLGCFRPGRPDDYVSMSTERYFKNFRENDDEVIEFDDFVLKLFPNENLRNYYLSMIAQTAEGGNVLKSFIICTGEGNNGKSVLFKIMEETFGEYYGVFPRELFLRSNNNKGGPKPEVVQSKGKRIMTMSEFTAKDQVDHGILKLFTGNDSIFARGLHESGGKMSPQFTTWLQCNEPPRGIPSHDQATWNRIKEILFESNFVLPQELKNDPIAKSFEKQLQEKKFEADTELMSSCDDLADVLLWKILQVYNSNKGKRITTPKEVIDATNKYREDNDVIQGFIAERIEKVDIKINKDNESDHGYDNEEDELEEQRKIISETFIKKKDIFDEFKDWFKQNFPGSKMDYTNHSLVKELSSKHRLGTIKRKKQLYGFGDKNRFWGYRFIEEDGDDEEDFEDKE